MTKLINDCNFMVQGGKLTDITVVTYEIALQSSKYREYFPEQRFTNHKELHEYNKLHANSVHSLNELNQTRRL